MIWALALAVFATVTAGVYLALSRDLLRCVIGVSLIGAAANLVLFGAGRIGTMLPPVIPEGATVLSAAVNPLPFDLLRGKAGAVVAVDVASGASSTQGVPEPWEALGATMAVIGQGIVARKLAAGAPDLILKPNVGVFRLFDFFRASAVMRAADPIKAEVKERLAALLQ